jgi:hypothetical protein
MVYESHTMVPRALEKADAVSAINSFAFAAGFATCHISPLSDAALA